MTKWKRARDWLAVRAMAAAWFCLMAAPPGIQRRVAAFVRSNASR